MLILTLRTDKPEAELGLFRGKTQLAYLTWEAHRQLAETIHDKIEELVQAQAYKLNDLDGIVVFKGPGSFTGLRIGLSVANALAYSLTIPLVSETGAKWTRDGIGRLQAGEDERVALPEYGSPPHITQQKR